MFGMVFMISMEFQTALRFCILFALLAMAYEGYCVLVRGKRKVSLWIYLSVILCGILIGITMKTVDNESWK